LKSKNYFVLETAPDGCDKPVCRAFPKTGVSGLVLHRKVMVNDGDCSETCVSCTLLMEKGEPHGLHQEFPFTTDLVASFPLKDAAKTVISRLTMAGNSDGWQDFGLQTPTNANMMTMLFQFSQQLLQQPLHSQQPPDTSNDV
jgi:hypothetical protein